MESKQKQRYADAIVEGTIPTQRVFTRIEVEYLVKCALTWAAYQIDHEADEIIPYISKKDRDFVEGELESLATFIEDQI